VVEAGIKGPVVVRWAVDGRWLTTTAVNESTITSGVLACTGL